MAAFAPALFDFGILIIGAVVLGGIAVVFRQPLILAYIAAGILLGSQGLHLIGNEQYLYDISSELGIAMLLFVVGLELSIKKMFDVRNVVTFGVVAKSLILLIAGMFIGYGLGFTFIESIYIGLVIAFSSTLLIVKSLGERHQVDTLAGRILIGGLVFEDVLVIITISVLGVVAGIEPTGFVKWLTHLPGIELVPFIQNIALVFGAVLLLLIAYLLNRYVARFLFRAFSHNAEMVFVSALGFLFVIAFLAAEVGFSIAIGAFIAGVIVANTDYYLDVLGRVKTLATFFALLFFATLGFKVTFDNFTHLLIPIIAITAAVVILKPLVVGTTVRLFGYDKTTSILSALHMSQISEFGLILIAYGIKFKHVSDELLTVTIIVLLLSFTISMYYMNYSASLTAWLQRRFRSLAPDADHLPEVAIQHASCLLYGVEHIDEQFIAHVRAAKPQLVVVDPDPESVQYIRESNIPVIVGSAANEEVLERLPIEKLELVISTIPDYEQNLFLCDHLRKRNKDVVLIVSTQSIQEALDLYAHGASYVHVTSFIEDSTVQAALAGMEPAKLVALRKAHLERLSKIAARGSATVDIDEFVARLTGRQIVGAAKALERTGRSVAEGVGKFGRGMKGKEKK